MRLAAVVLVAATAVLLFPAPEAGAELRFKRCEPFPFPCARLSVPLDRSGATPGRVSLFVGRVRAREQPRRGAVFALAGGPGQSASLGFGIDGLGPLEHALRRRDLIVFDQRGTGRSGLLRCRALERADLLDAGTAAGVCARRLGARRHHYTSRASVDDIEAIRRELGIPRITLYGTSYGAKVALGYALTYPGNVERLLLDSVVAPDGLDPFYLPSLAAVPRVMRALCRSRCRSFTRDPVADLGGLVRRMAARPLRGYVVDPHGRRRRTRLTRGELFLLLVAGDFGPELRAAFPGAVRAALDGDAEPALRLKHRALSDPAGPLPPRAISPALFAATICEETPFPWPRMTPPDPAERRRLAESALTSIPADAFGPFDRGATLGNNLLQLCDHWAAAPTAPSFGPGPLPDVPVLLLGGEDDLRTPVESAERVAAGFPRARVLVASATGHSALAREPTGCMERAVARFFRNQPVLRCGRARRPTPAIPPPPRRLRDVQRAAGVPGVRGRALSALALTLRDVADDFQYTHSAGGGLRGGRYRFDDDGTLHLRRVAFVPGVRVSGRLRHFAARRQRGGVLLSGPATPDGSLLVRGRRLSGRLGGRPVSARLAVPTGVAAAARRRAASRPLVAAVP